MQSGEERAYHIFYHLIEAADESTREKYFLTDIEEFSYVNFGYSDADEFESIDKNNYKEMLECMEGLNFTEDERDGIFRIISAVAQLSSIEIRDEG